MWLGVACVAVKAGYLGVPSLSHGRDYVRDLAAISYRDVLFAVVFWAIARVALAAAGSRPRAASIVIVSVLTGGAVTVTYALASVIAFRVLGGFLTYSLLQLVGNVRMIGSSVALYLTAPVVTGLVAIPLAYVALVTLSARLASRRSEHLGGRRFAAVLWMAVVAWIAAGHAVFVTDWHTHGDWRMAENAPWVLVSSSWRAMSTGEEPITLDETFESSDLADFDPPPPRPPLTVTRPPNVILIVLESVAVRWTGLHGGQYETTPQLRAESTNAAAFDNFYAHVGRSSNALASIVMSLYPKLDFREFTEEYAATTRPSLSAVLHDRGYRTAFITPSDLSWAGWQSFLKARGFDEVIDYRGLACPEMLSTWGVEDRCMVDAIVRRIDEPRAPSPGPGAPSPGPGAPSLEPRAPSPEPRPFFIMGWTTQTHHPYEPTPGVPMLKLLREATPDDYELERYLNVIHETDRQLARIFDAVRRASLSDDTLVVIVGDHGQAFGYPHDSYTQGRTVYEEDVHVPLLVWSPRLYPAGWRSPVIGGHVDLAPTIAELAGIAAPAEWQGRSLFETNRPPRAYFYVTQDQFKLGVREERWKYIYDLRAGAEELYDLVQDPNEQQNLAAAHRDRCARLRQRLAAWTEANRRQYAAF